MLCRAGGGRLARIGSASVAKSFQAFSRRSLGIFRISQTMAFGENAALKLASGGFGMSSTTARRGTLKSTSLARANSRSRAACEVTGVTHAGVDSGRGRNDTLSAMATFPRRGYGRFPPYNGDWTGTKTAWCDPKRSPVTGKGNVPDWPKAAGRRLSISAQNSPLIGIQF